MKYYSLKYVTSLPNGFGGQVKMWRISILDKYKGDKGLLEHEKWHVRQWIWATTVTLFLSALLATIFSPSWLILGGLAPSVHTLLYKTKPYRKWSEVVGYRIQLRTQSYPSPQFAINALMFKYGLDMTEEEVKTLLRIE